MPLQPQTPEWYDRLTTLQEGYYYPWRSRLGNNNGEQAYLTLVHQHLHPEAQVLDIACGHGDIALGIAPFCRTVLGYDRTPAWVALAQQHASERGITNATFVCHDSSAAANGGRVRLPAEEAAFDLLICSKGPFHWIADAPRVARPGAVLLMLVPDTPPPPPWHAWLPEPLRWQLSEDPHWARASIERRLAEAGLRLHSWWSFDVPEVFPEPEQLYAWRTWGYTPDEVPAFAEVAELFARIFAEHGTPDGVEVRHRRHVWKAIVPG